MECIGYLLVQVSRHLNADSVNLNQFSLVIALRVVSLLFLSSEPRSDLHD